jgi:hypothetical protein
MKYYKIIGFLGGGLILLILVYFLFIYNHNDSIPKRATNSSPTPWWNDDFAFRKEIIITNLEEKYFKINHTQLAIEGKSRKNGKDLQIIYWDGKQNEIIETTIINSFKENTLIKFSPIKSGSYYLYFGSQSNYANTVDDENLQIKLNSKYEEIPYLNLENFQTLDLSVLAKKEWFLYDKKNDTLTFEIYSNNQENEKDQFYVLDIDNEKIINATRSGNLISVPANMIQTGQKYLSILLYSDGQILRSNNFKINISKPLFVNWSINWEGTDPGSENIALIDQISTNYSIPLTQFFNPRVLVKSSISNSRKKDIVKWLKTRVQENTDEISLHLHMQHDMLLQAGIKTRENEKTWNGDLRGYDTPPTAYDYNDFKKLLTWSLKTFSDYGISDISGFRSGGWFAHQDILRAVYDSNFLYDASSIEPFEIGEKKFKQDWEIDALSQPFYIKENSTKIFEDLNLNLLEIPTNGGETLYSDIEKLKQNFYLNYPKNQILHESRLISYASNADWFYQEVNTVKALFDEIQNFRYELDQGPVIFVTLEEYMSREKL